jgi:hypothetical protein
LALINNFPAADRQLLLDALARLDPADAERYLTRLSQRQYRGLLEGLRRRRGFVPKRREIVEHIDQVTHAPGAPRTVREASIETIRSRRTTWRVSDTEIQAGRQVLGDRMERTRPPGWARGNRELWSPHHVIPVEHQGHWVFDVLRNTREGWDHHNPFNGIALPTTSAARRLARTRPGGIERRLPLHQVTLEFLQERGLPGANVANVQRLAFHPVYNQNVLQRLNAIDESLRRNPAALRREVRRLITELKNEIRTRRQPVLF